MKRFVLSMALIAGLPALVGAASDEAQAQFNAGILAFKARDMVRAEAALAKATSLAPKDAEAWELYGTVLIARGKRALACQALENSVAADKKRLNAWQLLAKAAAEAGDEPGLVRAAEAWGKAAELTPKDGRFASNQGLILAKLGKEGEAIAVMSKAASLPGGGLAQRSLCALYNKGGDFAKAAEACQGALLQEPRAQEWYNLGYAQQQLGRKGEARASMQAAVKADPRHAASLYSLAFMDFEAGQPQKALDGFLAAAKAKGGAYPEAQYNAAVLLGDMGRYEDAAGLYRALIKGGDQSPETAANLASSIDAGTAALIDRGRDAYEKGDLKTALAAWERALRLDPENAQARALTAQVKAQAQKMESKQAQARSQAAREAKVKAHVEVERRLKEEDSKLLVQGLAAAEQGDDAAAVRYLDFFLKKTPGNAKAETALFQSRARLRRHVDEILQQAGLALANGQRAQALELSRKALEMDPGNGRAATLAAQAGQVPKADAGELRKQYYQGVELYLKGDLAGAVTLWQKVLDLDANNLDAKRSITRAQLELDALKKRGKG